MKNLSLLLVLFFFAEHSFSMENFVKPTVVIYQKGFAETEIPALLWEEMKNAQCVDVKDPELTSLITNVKNDTIIYGTSYDSDNFRTALNTVYFRQKSITVIKEEGDSNYSSLFKEFDFLDPITVDAKETSFIARTWPILSKENLPKGLLLLDKAYTQNPSENSLAVKKYYMTEGGNSFEEKKSTLFEIINADAEKLKTIIKQGEDYLANKK